MIPGAPLWRRSDPAPRRNRGRPSVIYRSADRWKVTVIGLADLLVIPSVLRASPTRRSPVVPTSCRMPGQRRSDAVLDRPVRRRWSFAAGTIGVRDRRTRLNLLDSFFARLLLDRSISTKRKRGSGIPRAAPFRSGDTRAFHHLWRGSAKTRLSRVGSGRSDDSFE